MDELRARIRLAYVDAAEERTQRDLGRRLTAEDSSGGHGAGAVAQARD
jgi:hypothetical protein